jgi:putative ABC transport system permease protein
MSATGPSTPKDGTNPSLGASRGRSLAERVMRALLRLFPFDFRADHGRELEQTLRAQYRDAAEHGGVRAVLSLWMEVLGDFVTTAPREHLAVLKQDLGYAFRALRRAPVFAASAVLTLALGMSAATGMVAVVDAVMFRPLTVERPDEIVSISNRNGAMWLSWRDLQDYRAATNVLTDAVGLAPRSASLIVDGAAERIAIGLVTDNYFSMLGVSAAAGRVIQPEKSRAWIDDPVLVLSYAYWQSRFGGDAAVIGRTVRVSGAPFTIIGVASARFRGTEPLLRVSGYVPAGAFEQFNEGRAPGSSFEDRTWRMFATLARLKPGFTIAQARAELDVRAARLAREFPSTHKDVSLRVVPETHTRPTPELGPFLRLAATALAGLAAIVLLITSANLANLLMARAASRGREVALRAALGARRGRIVRQFVTESVVIAVLGGLLAIPIVMFAMSRLRAFIAGVTAAFTFDPDFSVDGRVIASALAIAIGAGVVAGLAPALWVLRSDAAASLRSAGRGVTERFSGRLRSALVVAQVALSLTLLVSGGLFVRSLDRARNIELGFDPDGLVMASASPGLLSYDRAKRVSFYEGVLDRVAAVPGVEAAAWIQFPPLGVVGDSAEVSPDPRPSEPDWRPPIAAELVVTPDYFTAARTRQIEGRPFDDRDRAGAPLVAIINETLARRFWPNQSPVGRRLVADTATLEIIGVVQNGKYQNVGEEPRGAVFRPLAQIAPEMATLAVRTSRALADVGPDLRDAFRRVDPDVAVFDVRPMMAHLDNGSAFFPFRLAAFMTSLFGAMGVLLAAIGLYGMVAFQVGRRTQEIGVRMALGAGARDIYRDVLSQGARFAAIGIGVGVLLSGGLAQLLQGLLLGISPFDPLTYLLVAAFLAITCLVASFVPARRAVGVDPLTALRTD